MQHYAGELRKELIPAEAKLWRVLRSHQANDATFAASMRTGREPDIRCFIAE
jgi:very-short-patch-repair endonuclease